MRCYDPTDDYDVEEAARMGAEAWQLNMLKLNPSYVHWGPYEDYMGGSGGWSEPIHYDTWDDFEIELDDLNEVVNFYFHVRRDGEGCTSCDRTGYNPETKDIADGFYDLNGRIGERWDDKITPEECQALIDKNRLFNYVKEADPEKGWVDKDPSEIPPIEELTEQVNKAQRGRGFGHDAINRGILVRARAERQGVWGLCDTCEGKGHYYFEDEGPQLAVTMWLIHPRKGAARGVEVKSVQREEVPEVLEFLREANERNINRFKKAVEFASAFAVDDVNDGFDSLNELPYTDE